MERSRAASSSGLPVFTAEEITTAPALSLFTFALKAGDDATRTLLQRINDDGRIYLTQTLHRGRFVIRVQVGQFDCTRADVMMIPTVVQELAGGS